MDAIAGKSYEFGSRLVPDRNTSSNLNILM